jgi:K+-sensing histidine kinase KdpD
VPDSVFDEAAEMVMVDLPDDALLARLKQGKVNQPEQHRDAVPADQRIEPARSFVQAFTGFC